MRRVGWFFVRIFATLAGVPFGDEIENVLTWVWDTLKIWARKVREDLEGRRED